MTTQTRCNFGDEGDGWGPLDKGEKTKIAAISIGVCCFIVIISVCMAFVKSTWGTVP
jgi:hypothetical protein